MLDFSSTIKMECPLLVHLLVPLYLVSETKNVLLSQSISDHKSCKVGFMFTISYIYIQSIVVDDLTITDSDLLSSLLTV